MAMATKPVYEASVWCTAGGGIATPKRSWWANRKASKTAIPSVTTSTPGERVQANLLLRRIGTGLAAMTCAG